MKIFHLSDLHIGIKLFNYDLGEEQWYILSQIIELARTEKPDAIVIAGDIYDKAIPSSEAVELFDRFVLQLTEAVPNAEIMLISGNHDSAPRVNIFRNILNRQRLHMIGLPPQTPDEHIERVVLTDLFGNVNFYLLPFVKPSTVKAIVGTDENGNNLTYDSALHKLISREDIDASERNVLVSHQFYLPKLTDADNTERADSEICTVGNIDAVDSDILAVFDYSALGHIHKPMKVGSDTCRYCGTPIQCSISEAGQQKGIIMVDMGEKGRVETSFLPLTPLREVRIISGAFEDVLKQSCDDYVSIVLTDKLDLDVFDLHDRIRFAFPRLLEIRREGAEGVDYQTEYSEEDELDVYELCCSFLKDTDDEEKAILRDTINAVKGAME